MQSVERALDGSAMAFRIKQTKTLSLAVKCLREASFDVVLLDLGLPDGQGLSNLAAIQEADPKAPVVILSGLVDDNIALEAVKAGAQDYLSKAELSTESAVKAISYSIERKLTETRLREGVSELKHAAQVDPLTGLLNRRAFLQHLQRIQQRRVSDSYAVSCAMLDIDFFKHVNDTYGHPAGDEALRSVASLLLHESRAGDLVCRFGGEEFCVVLVDTDERAAFGWADRVRSSLQNRVIRTERQDLQLTASLGVAQASSELKLLEGLIDQADQALLASKQSGRNRVTAFSSLRDEQTAQQVIDGESLDNPKMTLADLSFPPIRCLLLSDEIADAANELLDQRMQALPVVDDAGRFVGVVTEKELLQAIPGDGAWCGTVEEIVERTAMAFPSDGTVDLVREFMTRTQTAQVVVVEDRRPLGVLHRADLLRLQQQTSNAVPEQLLL
ncbi:Response regulator PleD [Adhaeretor mobilis]|uniref:diguanylate cyclase n=2 Tax=Adhaeretor mobilis TaxID=1930276 RepID=A0A517MTV1_9BACT|nr:Response regulator PleD [Adhaeretor mobilis]